LPSANTCPCRLCRGLSPPNECALPGAPKKRRSPRGLRRSCPSIITYGPRQSAQQLHRSVHPMDRSHAQRALRVSLNGIPASTRFGLTKNLATNQRATRRDRTNDCMCHLDHLLQLPWAHCQRVPPTEATRPYSTSDRAGCPCLPGTGGIEARISLASRTLGAGSAGSGSGPPVR
jgi:hypothetical protein